MALIHNLSLSSNSKEPPENHRWCNCEWEIFLGPLLEKQSIGYFLCHSRVQFIIVAQFACLCNFISYFTFILFIFYKQLSSLCCRQRFFSKIMKLRNIGSIKMVISVDFMQKKTFKKISNYKANSSFLFPNFILHKQLQAKV